MTQPTAPQPTAAQDDAPAQGDGTAQDDGLVGTRATQPEAEPPLVLQRDSLQGVLRVWLVRVVLVTAVMFALDYLMGPVRLFWPLIGFYAAVSLISSLALYRVKNRQIDRLQQLARGTGD